MATHRLAAIFRRTAAGDCDFLLLPQTPPPKLPEEEYDAYVDSLLYDLPSAPLLPLAGGQTSSIVVGAADSFAGMIKLRHFDLDSAVSQILDESGVGSGRVVHWSFHKYVEEPEFGPEPFVHTVFLVGVLESDDELLQGGGRWMSIQSSLNLLVGVKQGDVRIGPLVVAGLIAGSDYPKSPRFQEYPPGLTLVPMKSKTLTPFLTTNLVVISPGENAHGEGYSSYPIKGDALIMDPGCLSDCHAELEEYLSTLPENIVVFVTHHHFDHIAGLSTVQKCKPHAILVAHENTMRRIGKAYWSRGYTPVFGDEEICISGQKLKVISAPGHTDGHIALLHISTNSLVVGDHCVGHGSAVLDFSAGGNMKDYFSTTYKFLEISPHVIIPMHGRINKWPKRMLCGYLKHRRDREMSILKAIEDGAETLYQIIERSYVDVDPKLWIFASSNVRLHVDHLADQGKLPKEFSLNKFRASCRINFFLKWIWKFCRSRTGAMAGRLDPKLLGAVAVASVAVISILYKNERG